MKICSLILTWLIIMYPCIDIIVSHQSDTWTSLKSILQSTASKQKRSVSLEQSTESEHSVRHHNSLRHIERKLQNARNTTKAGYATIIKRDGQLPEFVCPKGQWACPFPKHNLVPCIAVDKVCDYVIDCPNGEDEDPVQCAHTRLRTAKAKSENSCSDLKQRIANLERGIMKLSCQLELNKESIRSHKHSSNNQLPEFSDYQMTCPNFGFQYSIFNYNDDT